MQLQALRSYFQYIAQLSEYLKIYTFILQLFLDYCIDIVQTSFIFRFRGRYIMNNYTSLGISLYLV